MTRGTTYTYTPHIRSTHTYEYAFRTRPDGANLGIGACGTRHTAHGAREGSPGTRGPTSQNEPADGCLPLVPPIPRLRPVSLALVVK